MVKREITKILNVGVSKTSDHIQIKIKVSNPSQEPPAPTKVPYQDLKDMDVLCTFKIKIEPKFGKWMYQRLVAISKSRSRCKTKVRSLQCPQKTQMRI